MVKNTLLKQSLLALLHIALINCTLLPDVNEIDRKIRELTEGASNYGKHPSSQQKYQAKSLEQIHSEHAPVKPGRIVEIMVDDDSKEGSQSPKSIAEPLDVPNSRFGSNNVGSSKFDDSNDFEAGSDPELKIWYGDDATEGEFPFMARVQVSKTFYSTGSRAGYSMCGGSIISSRIILTAAHCLVSNRDNWNEMDNPAHYQIRVGDHSSRYTSRNEKMFKAEGVIIHPDYDNGNTLANDIAMVILAEDIEFGPGVEAIKLPETSDEELMDEGKSVTVAGWGVTEGGGSSSILQKMTYKFSNRVWCKRYWYYRRMNIIDGMACTDRVELNGGSRYAHIWSGDSGSALFAKNSDGSFTQLALVSWSSSIEQRYAPDIHTNVFHYREWIKEHMNMLESTYLERSRAFLNTYQELEFTNLRHYLYRRTNLYSSSSNLRIQADVYLDDLDFNHFVLIYDGADVEKDKMIAMLTRNEESTEIVSTNTDGLTVVVQTNDRGSLRGSVSVRYKAIIPPSSGGSNSLRCPNGFWPCQDRYHCIRDSDVCDSVQGSAGECRDASDEDEGCKKDDDDDSSDSGLQGWKSVVPGRTDFSWDYTDQSIAVQTSSYKGSWDKIYVEMSHKTAEEPMFIEIRFGSIQLYFKAHNCTEYFFGINYPSSYYSRVTTEYVISFNDDYMSVIGNEEVLWNLEYGGNLAMDSCYKAVQGMSKVGKFAAEDTATTNYKIMSKPGNDKLDKQPDSTYIKDYSQYDSVPYEAMVRDTAIYYDIFAYSLQVVTRGTIDIKTGIVFELFEQDSEEDYSFIEIFFYKSAPYYYLKGCTESVVMFELPAPDKNGDRVWTFEMDRKKVVFRCNGREFGRVVAGSKTVKRGCSSVLGNQKLDKIKFPSQYDTASDAYRVLCLGGCMDVDNWRPIKNYYVEFQWDISEFSLQLRTGDGKGSELLNMIGFYESEEKFYEYQHVAVYHGKTHFWVWIRNCTEYWIPLRYHSSNDKFGDSSSATFTFHKDYASVLSNGELLWNFYYDSDIATDLCIPTIKSFFSNSFIYYGNERDPKDNDKFRLVNRPNNDTEMVKPEPDFKDFSDFDDQKFEEFSLKTSLEYDLVTAPLQLKTEIDLPEQSNFSLSLLNTNKKQIGSITVGMWEKAAYFLIRPCHEGRILISIPEPLKDSKTRVWTVEPSENTIVFRCNGYELGRVARGSKLVLDACSNIFGGKVKIVSMKSAIPVFYRVLCLDNSNCVSCPAGSFKTDNGCQQCKENTFSEAGASSCTSCPEGMASDAGSTSKDDCYYVPCPAGSFMTKFGCQQCRENTFSEAGASFCTRCPEGSTSGAGSTSKGDCYFAPCPAGSFKTDNGCQQCKENTFSEAGASSCTRCPDDMASDAGSTSKDKCYYVPCPAGSFMTENGCQKCEENTFSEAGASSCTSCPENMASDAGSISKDACYYVTCLAGSFMTENGCQQCRENTFSKAGASSCTSCPEGMASDAGSSSKDDCYYVPCSAGSFKANDGCQQCKENTYSGPGASSCTSCPEGKASDAGSTSKDDCYYVPCPAGSFMTNDGCQQCKENTYSEPGASSCTSCPEGMVSNAGSTSKDDCYKEKEEQKNFFKTVSPKYKPHLGLLMVSGLMNGDWTLACRIGIGRTEINTLCKSMGYKTGTTLDYYVKEFSDIYSRTRFGVTDMTCQESSTSLSDCSFTPYSTSKVPCLRGEAVAVSCSNDPFQLSVGDFYSRVSRRGSAYFRCSASASRFGIKLDLQDSVDVAGLHRKNDGEINVVINNLMYKNRRGGYWWGRGYVKTVSWYDRCYICLARMKGFDHMDIVLSSECSQEKEKILSEIKDLMDRKLLRIG